MTIWLQVESIEPLDHSAPSNWLPVSVASLRAGPMWARNSFTCSSNWIDDSSGGSSRTDTLSFFLLGPFDDEGTDGFEGGTEWCVFDVDTECTVTEDDEENVLNMCNGHWMIGRKEYPIHPNENYKYNHWYIYIIWFTLAIQWILFVKIWIRFTFISWTEQHL